MGRGGQSWMSTRMCGGVHVAAACSCALALLLVCAPADTFARTLHGLDGPACTLQSFGVQANAMNEACCPRGSKCANTDGLPDTCTAECAMAFHPFFTNCEKTLAKLQLSGGGTKFGDFNAKCISTDAAPLIAHIDNLTAAGCKFNVSTIVARGCFDAHPSAVLTYTKNVVADCAAALADKLCTAAPATAAKLCPVTCKLGCGKTGGGTGAAAPTAGSRRSLFGIFVKETCENFQSRLGTVSRACGGAGGSIPTDCSYTCAKVVPPFYKKCKNTITTQLTKGAAHQFASLAHTCAKFPSHVLLKAIGRSACGKKHGGGKGGAPCAVNQAKLKALRAELEGQAKANTTRKLQEQAQTFETKFAAITSQLAEIKGSLKTQQATITSLSTKVATPPPPPPPPPKSSQGLVAMNKTLTTLKELVDMGRLLSPGTVVIWAGAANKIPNGWSLCNGKSGTPDLQDKFVLGAGPSHKAGAKASAKKSTSTKVCRANRNSCNTYLSWMTEFTALTSYASPYYALAYIMRTNSYCCKCQCSKTSTIESSAIPLVGQKPTDRCTKHCGDEACPGGTFGQFKGFC